MAPPPSGSDPATFEIEKCRGMTDPASMPIRRSPAAKPAAAPSPGAARIFLVYGSDDLSATRKADEIVNHLCPPAEQAFGLETIQPEPGADRTDVVCATLRNVCEALRTPSFLGGAKTVYLRGAPFFNPLTEPGKFAEVKAETERLVELLKPGLPAGVAFVLLTDNVNKSTTFYKTFQSLGEVHAFDEPEKPKEAAEDFLPRVQALLAEQRVAMPPDVLSAFLDRTGYNLRQVTAEVEKLALYLGGRPAALADIQLMVAPVRESKFYEFADTFCNGNIADTLRVMRRLFDQRVFPVPMIMNLQDRLRQLFVLSDCLRRGWARLSGGEGWKRHLAWSLPPEGEAALSALEKDPRKGNPFALVIMAGQAARFPPGRWYRWLTAAVDAQAAMTGGEAVDAQVVLELFVLRTLGELAVVKPARP